MKKPVGKQPFYRNRNWLIGFVVSLAAVFLVYFLGRARLECEMRLSLFKLPQRRQLKEAPSGCASARGRVGSGNFVYSAW